MFRSMTAYGRAHVTTESGSFLIEIHSVNRKSLDITVNLPKELLLFDMDFRKELSKEVKRGFITVRVTREEIHPTGRLTLPDLDMMKSIQEQCQTYAKELGYNPKEAISFSDLLSYGFSSSGPPDLEVDENLQEQLLEGFKKALSKFIAMREREGATLLEDVGPRLDEIEEQLDKIAERVKAAPEMFREKLEKRLEELDVLKSEDDERMMRELILLAEKVDVTEEMTRLRSHVQQFRDLMSSKKRRVGRELDFLIQEMNREVNTTAAKSQDIEITQAILEMKTEQEKIREQIQNIE
ncbi:YicC/YloC family endoribonuclease [Simkania sp.]|uniref:YicC/YloC family endoribonuclease n=1 Tax=Simkania sp. TaxID=34094 RepID=UPI003B51C8D2